MMIVRLRNTIRQNHAVRTQSQF